MEWTNDLTLEFLHLYEQENCIWNPRDPSYKNRATVGEAWKRIEESFSGNCPITELKRKRDSLMAMFRTLLTKVKASKRAANDEGDVYKPSWFAFKTMARFMDGVYQPKSPSANLEALDRHELHIQEYPDPDATEIGVDGEQPIDEFMLLEEDNSSSRTCFPERVTEPTINKPKVARNKMKAKTNSNRNSTSMNNILKILSKKHIEDDDDCSLYAKLLARKLKSFDECTREILMNKIDNLIFRAKMYNKNHPLRSLPSPSPPHHSFQSATVHPNYNYPQYSYMQHSSGVPLSTTLHPQAPPQHPTYSLSPPESSSYSQPTSTLEVMSTTHPKVENVTEIL